MNIEKEKESCQLLEDITSYTIEEIEENKRIYDDYHHFAYFFLNKMIEHCNSFLQLYKNNRSDCLLVCRTMIEGLGMINYVNNEGDNIAERWRKYLAIEYYQMIIHLEKRIEFDKSIKNDLLQRIKNECDEFIVKRSFICINSRYYSTNWYYPNSISELIDKLPAKFLRLAYYEYSTWHHWGPLSINDTSFFSEKVNKISPHTAISDSILVPIFCIVNSIYPIKIRDSKKTDSIDYFGKRITKLMEGLE